MNSDTTYPEDDDESSGDQGHGLPLVIGLPLDDNLNRDKPVSWEIIALITGFVPKLLGREIPPLIKDHIKEHRQ